MTGFHLFSSPNITNSWTEWMLEFFYWLPTGLRALKKWIENCKRVDQCSNVILWCIIEPLTLHSFRMTSGKLTVTFTVQRKTENIYTMRWKKSKIRTWILFFFSLEPFLLKALLSFIMPCNFLPFKKAVLPFWRGPFLFQREQDMVENL